MMTAPRNNMATPFRVRDGVGAHVHEWAHVGFDSRNEQYQQCRICDARRCVNGPRSEAQRQDWLEYQAPWTAERQYPGIHREEPAPVKRKPGRPRKTA
jgi:hypothetical protein